jgi:hypothetical protein
MSTTRSCSIAAKFMSRQPEDLSTVTKDEGATLEVERRIAAEFG